MKTVKAWAGVVDGEFFVVDDEDSYGVACLIQAFKLKRDASLRFQKVIRVEIREVTKKKRSAK